MLEPSYPAFDSLVAVFRALGSPARLALLRRLSVAPARVGVLSDELGIPQPMTSHHLGVLRDAGLVVARRDGRATVYALTDGPLSQAVAQLVVSESPEM